MKDIIEKILNESVQVKEKSIRKNTKGLIALAEKIALAFTNDRKVMLCGNGGSAADAQHIAAEFINRFELERPPLPAIALTTDSSIITCIGNDYSFDDIFAKQIKALGVEGDVLLAISTSGNSSNVVKAAEAAREQDIYVCGITGNDGGRLKDSADSCLIVESRSTARIQETHILMGHMICMLVDYMLFQQGIRED
jgi:D-sedoheptulose 7-phosphate isomerase